MISRPDRGEHEVARPLDQPSPASEMRFLDMQQRKAHERPDVHSRSGHLDQPGIHQQLDSGALQRPSELA